MPTFQTKLPRELTPLLDAQSSLYNAIEHDLHVSLMQNKSFSSVEKHLQLKYNVDSTTVRNVWHNLKGKHKGIKELREYQSRELKHAITGIQSAIKKWEKRAKAKLKKSESAQYERFVIHQKKRRLDIKRTKLKKLEAQQIKLCFGSKKLFNAQHHLAENGYDSHEDWLKDWRSARSSNFMMVGNKIYQSGNQLCRITTDGELTLTTPLPLVKRFGSQVKVSGIHYRYGQDWIDAALTPTKRISNGKRKSSRIGTQQPVTHRFVRKGDDWYIHTHVELPDIPVVSSSSHGVMGIDLNVESIAWAICDSEGNLYRHGQIAINLKGKTSEQSADILSKAINEIITIAKTYQVPIVIENLDFSKKKASLREQGKRYAEMLSSFAYSKFREFVEAKAYQAGLRVAVRNPAYSSLIGLTKFMSMYGLNSGTAAALVLARRYRRFSERLPKPVMAFLSPVDEGKHLWSSWRRMAFRMKGVRRHSFFAMRVRVEVKPKCEQNSVMHCGKFKNTSVIPSETSALCSRTVSKFTQLCLSF